jgi:hypothetical protein
VPDEHTCHLISELFERKAAGASWLELARWLDEVTPKPNGRYWARQTVIGMIRSRTYLGEARHGEHVNPNAHEPLVTIGLWHRAQREPGRRTPRGHYLLSGLVRCAGCGRNMRASSGGLKKSAVYVCVTPECPLHYSTAVVARLDAEVVEQFFAHLDAYELRAVADREVIDARKLAARLRGDVERLAAVTPSHPAAIAAHQAALESAEAALTDAEMHLDELLGAQSQPGPDTHRLRADWDDMPLTERRERLREGIDAVVVRRALRTAASRPISERIVLAFRGEAPAALLQRGPAVSWEWDDDPRSLRAAA